MTLNQATPLWFCRRLFINLKSEKCVHISNSPFLALHLFPLSSYADEPFIQSSNWGGTGLKEIPSARVMREDGFRPGYSQIKPYKYYYAAISTLKGLEVDLRITEVDGIPALTTAYGNYRDKAFDVKYQFLTEGKYMPALSIGFIDPHGTRIIRRSI